jgi:mannose-6-phosphate isomerase-like protein (cupin superfamily)
MSDIVKKELANINFYQGEHAIKGVRFRYAAKELGVTAWGMNILEIEAGCADYPEHDHVKDGQEEVYVVLKGSGLLRSGEKQWDLGLGDLIRVGPNEKRKILPGPDGITVLAIGATPGQAYRSR